ncbi:MAG: DUF1624 domain-containing protein [Clostridia bacterium]|nr:DUF1624 domain-containing protein [Clostridia bacterium]
MKTEAAEKSIRRYGFPDTVRGVLILGMIAYHTLFDIALLWGWDMDRPLMKGANVMRDIGAACFVFLSGFCFHLGRHNVRKGLLLSGAGLAITGVTYLFDREAFVVFGVLTLLGAAKLLLCVLDRPLRCIPALPGCFISLVLFVLFFFCNYGYAGFYGFVLFRWPQFLYRNYVTAFFGFPFNGFASSDYFGFLPWFFICLCGYFTFLAAYGKHYSSKVISFRIPFFADVGRYSLYVYLLHQPVIYFLVFATKKWLL